jgi:tetratricopeptide (TPR) repeat protein
MALHCREYQMTVFPAHFLIYLGLQLLYRMIKKRKLILSLCGAAIFLALSLFVLNFFLASTYRNQLPEYPDLETIPKSLREQILVTYRITYLNTTADNLGKLGMVYHSSSYYEKAIQCYQLAVKKNSSKWIWSYYLGYLNMEQGESSAAIENFMRVVEKNPKNYLALFYAGETYQNLGLTENAENIFKKIASLSDSDFVNENTIREIYFPLQTYAMFRLARIYMNTNRLDSAEMTLRKIIENQMTFGPAYRLLGNVYNMKGNLPLSNKYNIRANDLAEYTPPVDNLADNIILMSRSDEYLPKQIEEAFRSLNFEWGIRLCNHALKYIPENKFVISNTIYGYLLIGDGKKALPYLDQHIKYFRDDFKELMNIADLLYDKKFIPQALNYFNQAKKLEPENSRLALWLSERGMKKDGLILLNEQLKNDPENVKILSDAVHLLLNLGEKEMAMTYLTTLKRLSPSDTDVKLLTGMVEEKEGDLKNALSIYEEAFKSDPKDITIVKYLANFYIRNKMWEKAIDHFRLSLNYHPNDPFLLEGLGRLLTTCPNQKLRDLNEGREYSERAFISFKSPFATKISAGKILASAYAELGDRKKAYMYLNKTIDLARRRNVSKDYINYLENILKQYSSAN